MDIDLELTPVSSGQEFLPPPPNHDTLIRLGFAPQAVNSLHRKLWELAFNRGYDPSRREAVKSGIVNTTLVEFVIDASRVFSIPTVWVVHLMGIPTSTWNGAHKAYKAAAALNAEAALTAVLAADPKLFETAARMARSASGRVQLAEAKMETLGELRSTASQTSGTINDNE